MHKLNSAPAFKFAALFISGILIGGNIKFNFTCLLFCLSILILFLIYFHIKKFGNSSLLIIISAVVILSGIIKSNFDFFIIPDNSISNIRNTPYKSESRLIGIIDDLPESDSSKIKFIIKCKSCSNGDSLIDVEGLVLVTIIKDTTKGINEPDPELSAGDEVKLFGKLSEPAGERNPGEFDYRKYLEPHNIHKIFYVKGIYNVEKYSSGNLSYLYQKILFPAKLFANKNIETYVRGDEGAFLKGLVTGDRGDFTKEMKDYFIKAGVMHLIAVSGLNVAYIIISITLVLSLFRIPLIPKTIITILIIIFYCLFTGCQASIIRASVMAILVLIAYIIQRKINFYNIVGIAALVVLIYDSKQLFDAGFILSFCAVLSMVFFYTRFENIFISRFEFWKKDLRKYFYYFLVLFFTSLSAQIGTIPITALYFGKISLISLVANSIAVPLSNISLAIGFFQIVVATFSSYLSSVIGETNSLLLWFQLIFIKFCAGFDFSYFEFYKFNTLNTIIYFFILIYIVYSNFKNLHFRISISLLILIFTILVNINFHNNLKITFISVGQGESALIQTPEGKNILIDCGPLRADFDSGENIIAPYLKRNDIKNIDLLILTHNHNDHAGGSNFIIKNFFVKKVLINFDDYNIYFEKLLSPRNFELQSIKCGDVIKIDNLKLYVLYPFDSTRNGSPLVILMKYKDESILFTSDISKDEERNISVFYGDFLKSNILKVSHHGSKNSSSPELLAKCRPEYSVISCGLNNRFNHPAAVTLEKLEFLNSNIYRTDLDGAVIFESDGYSLKLKNE